MPDMRHSAEASTDGGWGKNQKTPAERVKGQRPGGRTTSNENRCCYEQQWHTICEDQTVHNQNTVLLQNTQTMPL